MKPVIISTGCTLLLIGIWTFFYCYSGVLLSDFSEELSVSLYEEIENELWSEAAASVSSLSEKWENNKAFFYMLSNHSIVREADIAFARLSEFIKNKEASDAKAEIAAIYEMFLSIRQSEAFSVDNIL